MNSDKDNTNVINSVSSSAGMSQNECNIITPTLSDVLNDDLVFRFYQCVKDIRLQQSPKQTSVMFYALCHALGQSISFLKVPNMNKIMFRQDEQIFAVNISGIFPPIANTTTNNSNNNDINNNDNTNNNNINNNNNNTTATNNNNEQIQHDNESLNVLSDVSYNIPNNDVNVTHASTQYSSIDSNSNNNTNNNNMNNTSSTTGALAAAAAAAANFFSVNDQSQQLLQAALSTVNSSDPNNPLLPNVLNTVTDMSGVKEKATKKKTKKPSPRDKEYSIRRNEIIQDLLKVTEANLLHQANTVDEDIKLIIQGRERTTKLGLLSPLHRFATFANLTAHYDSDFAPKNAGVYYNYEYFQLFLAFRDLEMERTQQMQQNQNDSLSKQDSSSGSNNATTSTDIFSGSLSTTTNNKSTYLSRPVMTQCRADIEKVLVNTNWEAIRRRLIIGERIYQLSNIIGRGFLLLSKQVSGRKLLHNFNTNEWTLLLNDFERPESLPLIKVLQTKYSPERLYQRIHPENAIYSPAMAESAAAVAAAEAMKVLPLLSGHPSTTNSQNNNTSITSLASTSSSSSSSSLPSLAYVDNKINIIDSNNNSNTSPKITSSDNHLSSLSSTSSITSENSSKVDSNITPLSNHDQMNDQNIEDYNDENPRKKLKSKE